MNDFAEIFSPGEFLGDELLARNWTQTEFAEIIGRPVRLVNEIILGKKSITPETALQFAEGLDTSPELWMNLESQYQLSKVNPIDNSIKRKAQLRERFPVREMIKRGWVDSSTNIEILEKQCLDFFEVIDLKETPTLLHAAKKTTYSDISILQLAWLFRAKKIACTQIIPKFSKQQLIKNLSELKKLMIAPEEIRKVTRILNDCGVRLVIVEPLPSSKIDGACFWLSAKEPVIALSTRLDRIDNFWFVLRHEIEHVIQGDGKNGQPIVDEEVGCEHKEKLPDIEVRANEAASEFCVSRVDLENYIARVNPYYFSGKRVMGFASRLMVHPGIVVGQLQNRTSEYKYLRNYLVKVRHVMIDSTPHDGWGNIYPI